MITTANITMLKSRMRKIGPRKAPKKTAGLEMKQLEGGTEPMIHKLCTYT